MSKRIVTNITVRYQETDQMGIVHHSVYPIWFEMGRTDLIKASGVSYKKIEKSGYYLPLAKLECNYSKPAFYDDNLILYTFISELKNRVITFKYELYREKTLLVTGYTKHFNTDKNFKITKFDKQIYEKLSMFFNID